MTKIINKYKNQKGQVALIVLIVSAIILTLGLSTSKKTVTETKITTDEELLKQAFNTAESGIDYYLGTGENTYQDPTTNYSASINSKDVNSASVGAGNYLLDYNELTLVNDSMYYWLVPHNAATGNVDMSAPFTGNIDICTDNAFAGSIRVDYFYTTANTGSGTYGVKRAGYNLSVGTTVAGYADASTVANDSCATGKKVVGTVTASETVPLLLAVTPLFGPTHLAARTSTALPIQGQEISSTSVVGDQNSGVRRTVKVIRRFEVPQFMLDGVTAEGDVNSAAN